MRSTLIAAVLTAGIIALAAPAASATETDYYTPKTPTPASLAGSTASAVCVRDVPWINYSVKLTDPDDQAQNHTAYLLMTNGTKSVEIPLGPLEGDSLKGSVLWPGASVDENGVGTGWPGWEEVDGEWLKTEENYAWTRDAITAELHVNPELTVPLSYPPASAACASPAVVMGASGSALALTGGTLPFLALGIGGTAVAAGVGALLIRRRRAHN